MSALTPPSFVLSSVLISGISPLPVITRFPSTCALLNSTSFPLEITSPVTLTSLRTVLSTPSPKITLPFTVPLNVTSFEPINTLPSKSPLTSPLSKTYLQPILLKTCANSARVMLSFGLSFQSLPLTYPASTIAARAPFAHEATSSLSAKPSRALSPPFVMPKILAKRLNASCLVISLLGIS